MLDRFHETAEKRLDLLLSQKAFISRSQAKKMIRQGLVKVRGLQALDPDLRLPETEELELDPPSSILPKCVAHIIYQDESIMVLDKKAGQVVHEGPGHPHESCLVHVLPPPLSSVNGPKQPGLVHRLDKDTSGLLLVARNDLSHRNLQIQMSEGKMRRFYLACLAGRLQKPGLWRDRIGHSGRQKMRLSSQRGREAVMEVKLFRQFQNSSLVECRLETGLQHQIRCQASGRGHPILGDPIYGRSKHTLSRTHGMLLHAYKLSLFHPEKGEEISFRLDPPWLKELLERS